MEESILLQKTYDERKEDGSIKVERIMVPDDQDIQKMVPRAQFSIKQSNPIDGTELPPLVQTASPENLQQQLANEQIALELQKRKVEYIAGLIEDCFAQQD